MENEGIKIWIRACRPFSFTGSVIPVALGAVYSIKETAFQPGYFILSLIAAVLLHASTNLLSDYDDFSNGIDTEDSYGSSGVIREKLLRPEEIKKGGYALLILVLAIGIYLAVSRGFAVLVIGLSGVLGGYFYTGKPLRLKYNGLGAPLVFLLFGPLMVMGGYYVQTQRISIESVLISFPLGLLTTAILHANDIRDIYHDRKAGISTLSNVLGENKAQKIYTALLILPYIIIVVLAICRVIPYWSLLCFITLPDALKNIKMIKYAKYTSELAFSDQVTAQLQAKFGVIYVITILIFVF